MLFYPETWINDNIPDTAVQLEWLTCYRVDRALVSGGKTHGRVCVYIHDIWCQVAVVVCRHCSLLLEFIIRRCRPFYLPREFTAILVAAVYTPPPPTAERERLHLVNCIMPSLNNRQPTQMGLSFSLETYHADLKTVLPKLAACCFPQQEESFWTWSTQHTHNTHYATGCWTSSLRENKQYKLAITPQTASH